MDFCSVASGEVLFNAKNRTQVLPSWGEKLSETCGSAMEQNQIEERLQDRHALISELKVSRKDQLATGKWIKESKMVQLIQQTGTFWDHMGVETDIGRCLFPEEGIFLIEMGELEVDHGGIPLSVQSAQAVMLEDTYQLDQYLVYAHLTRSGCKVVRHQPHLRFTRYEKQIRIDQYQTKRKKKKLKLKYEDSEEVQEIKYEISSKEASKSSWSTKENEIIIVEDPKSMDAALKEFYTSLGEEVKCPNKKLEQTTTLELRRHSDKWKEEGSKSEANNTCLDIYEKKKKEYLNLFPSMLGTTSQVVHVEEAELLPENSVPSKTQYEISLDFLNYYCKYVDDNNSDFVPQYQGNMRWRGGRSNFRENKNDDPYKHQSFAYRKGFDGGDRAWDRSKHDNRYEVPSWREREESKDKHSSNLISTYKWSDMKIKSGFDNGSEGGKISENMYGDNSRYSNHRNLRKRRLDTHRNGIEEHWNVGTTSSKDAQYSHMCNPSRLSQNNYDQGSIRDPENSTDYRMQTFWNSGGERGECMSNRRIGDTDFSGNKNFKESSLGVDVYDRKSREVTRNNDVRSRQFSEWYQHDVRTSQSLQDETSSSQMTKNPTMNLSVVPPWKNKRRFRRRDRQPATYPSYLVKLPVPVHSWKEYKSFVKSLSEDNLLMQGYGESLWRGPSTPLIKPSMATSLQNVLEKCCIFSETKDVQPAQEIIPKELHLALHFDVYLPNAPYRKSCPPIPNKRVTVIRNGIVPSLRQIQEVSRRFPDEAPVVSAVLLSGEVRLYTLSPCVLHPPAPS